MTVEILRFLVQPGRRDEFIDRNERVWTPALRERNGFVRREILLADDRPDEVVIVIYWRDRASLEAFPTGHEARLGREMADLVQRQEQVVYDAVSENDLAQRGEGA